MNLIETIIQHSERLGVFRYKVENDVWSYVIKNFDRTISLLASWADETYATMLLFADERPILISTSIEKRRYFAPSFRYPSAHIGERISRDLWGVEALYAKEDSAFLEDGAWSLTWPLSSATLSVEPDKTLDSIRYRFSPNSSLLPGLIGLSYSVREGRVLGVKSHLSMGHRGVLKSIQGKTPEEALPIISRASASGFVGHPLAFVRAIEQARGSVLPPQERDRRLLLLEIERMSVHLFDIAQTARIVGAVLWATHCEHARELLAELCVSHGMTRRLTDVITLHNDNDIDVVMSLAHAILQAFPDRIDRIRGLYNVFSSRLLGRVIVPTEMAWGYAISGPMGRASGRHVDMRYMDVGMRLDAFRSSGRHEGCSGARIAQRLAEIRDSLQLIERISSSMGMIDDAHQFPETHEGLGCAEGARGDIWYWVTLEKGRLKNVQVRDPLAPLLAGIDTILEGQKEEDIGLSLVSLGVSPAGVVL